MPRKRRRVIDVVGVPGSAMSPRARRTSHTSTAPRPPPERAGDAMPGRGSRSCPDPATPHHAHQGECTDAHQPRPLASPPTRGTPTPTANSASSTSTPPTSTALSAVPNVSIAHCLTGRGTLSTTRSPTLSTGELQRGPHAHEQFGDGQAAARSDQTDHRAGPQRHGRRPCRDTSSTAAGAELTDPVCSGAPAPRGSLGLHPTAASATR